MRNAGWMVAGLVVACALGGLVLKSLEMQRVRQAEVAALAAQAVVRDSSAQKEAARIAALQADYEAQVARYGRAIDPKVLVTPEGRVAARRAVADYRAACATFDAGLARSPNAVIADLRPTLQANQEMQAIALDRLLDFLTDTAGRYTHDARGFVFEDDGDLASFNAIAQHLRKLSNEERSLQGALAAASRLP